MKGDAVVPECEITVSREQLSRSNKYRVLYSYAGPARM